MPTVTLTTLGNITLTASVPDRGGHRSHQASTVVFFDEHQDAVATCSSQTLEQEPRTLSLRPDDAAWDVGPIDVARLLHLLRYGGGTARAPRTASGVRGSRSTSASAPRETRLRRRA